MPRLSHRQKLFAECLVADPKMHQANAAIAAGYSAKSAAQKGSNLAQLPQVREYINQLQSERVKRTRIDADYVLERLAEVDQMDVGDIYDDDGKLLPIKQWPKIWRQMVKEVDLKTGKVKLVDKLRNIELAGKHVGVRAFAELVEVDVKEGFGDRLAAARAKLLASKGAGGE